VRGVLDIIKLNKIPLIYSVSRFNLGGLGALFGVAKPTKAPRGDGTVRSHLRIFIKKAKNYGNVFHTGRISSTVNF